MKITICTETPGDVLNGLAVLQAIQGMSLTNTPQQSTGHMSLTNTPQQSTGQYQGTVTSDQPIGAANTAQMPTDQTNVKTGPSLQELIAGMTLKPTETSTLSDGSKISVGNHVTANGEDWHVEATYRGTIVATNETGHADILKTTDCIKSVRNADQSPGPRAGTPAALLGNPGADLVGPVSNEKASELRTLATNKVSGGKITVEAVFEKLGEFNVTTIDELSAANAAKFEEWISAVGDEPPAADGKFGF